ncbi:MAG: DUF1415 family protein [Sandaracinaceae bacterium]|nr:DUF1415 family protein [Sandaracinaceae bacterium]
MVGALNEAALAREAIRLYRRYAVEIVEALGFCPYAERCRQEGRTREVVIAEPTPTDERVLEAVEELAEDPQVEIGLVLLPRLALGQASLGRWVEVLRKAHAARRDGRALVAIEGFHPAAAADTSTPERLTPFVRRTPDPTLQLTRLSVLDRVRRGSSTGTAFVDPDALALAALTAPPKPPLHERISELNLETVRALGVEDVEARVQSILRDRDASYLALDPTIIRRAGA